MHFENLGKIKAKIFWWFRTNFFRWNNLNFHIFTFAFRSSFFRKTFQKRTSNETTKKFESNIVRHLLNWKILLEVFFHKEKFIYAFWMYSCIFYMGNCQTMNVQLGCHGDMRPSFCVRLSFLRCFIFYLSW
jgi:hypothetical protein